MPGRSHFCTALVCSLVLPLSACGGVDNVELKGGIFDMMGVSGNLLQSEKPKEVAARPGIVMPPSTQSLPAPGSERPAPPPAGEAWPVGPEDRARAAKERQLAEHRAYCEKALREQRVTNPDGAAPSGPLGSCEPGALEKMFGSKWLPGS